jgi:D-3-phosphoglycerate dehydrogenase
VAGDIAEHDPAPLVAAALAGLLEVATEERVTAVNAQLLAKERGLTLPSRVTPESPRHGSLLTLRGANGSTVVAGTAAAGEQRIARIGAYWVDMAPAPSMLITRHQDRPGTMGRIGLMLGEADVNISAMYLGRDAPRGDALMVLALDDPVPDNVAKQISEQEAVIDLWQIRLK